MQLIVSVFPIKIQSPQYLKSEKYKFSIFLLPSFSFIFQFLFLFVSLPKFILILYTMFSLFQPHVSRNSCKSHLASIDWYPWKSLSFVPSSVSSLCQRTSRCRNPRLTTTGDYHWSDNFRKSTELISRRWGQWQGEGWFPLDFL